MGFPDVPLHGIPAPTNNREREGEVGASACTAHSFHLHM